MLFKLLQLKNAEPPISDTLFGIIILDKVLHPLKVPSLMRFTPSGITILDKLLHPENASLSIEVTLFGIIICLRLLQPWNAPDLIPSTPFGIVISDIPVQSLNASEFIQVIPSCISIIVGFVIVIPDLRMPFPVITILLILLQSLNIPAALLP